MPEQNVQLKTRPVAHVKCALGPPSRATLIRAIRNVAGAEGHQATAGCLRELAAAALDWAEVLDKLPDAAGTLDRSLMRGAV